jgi:predicted dehydrogenase
MKGKDRREFLRSAGLAGVMSAMAPAAFAQSGAFTVETADSKPVETPKHSIRFAVIGLDHAHIFSMTAAVKRGGGELVSMFATDPRQLENFRKQFGAVKLASGEDEILNDKSIQLILSASIPDLRAPLAVRAMKAGKDVLVDKPGITTLAQLAAVRKAVKETKRKFAVMYSERLEVRAAVHAGDLVKQGAIGKVIQTINLGPHRMNIPSRPEWFFDKARYGGILTDIGSHQADQFLFYTNSTSAKVVASQTGNLLYPQYPKFEDFGDMLVTGNGGTGYIRVDWYTPDGLPTWGDGRLFILGTEGYIELRKYVDVTTDNGGGQVILVDGEGEHRINATGEVGYPFFGELILDVLHRTENAMTQEHAFTAVELALQAQHQARELTGRRG